METYDPFAPPHWRWRAAENIVHGTKRINGYRGDQHVLAAVEHLRAGETRQSKGCNPAIAESLGIFRDSTSLVKVELEARLVSGQSPRDIARACDIAENVVDLYRGIFFDAPPQATDYVRIHVIGHGPWRGFQNEEVRQFWAWVAMGGGPVVFQALLDSYRQAQRPGKAPTLDTYLQRDENVRIDVQAFVAMSVLPHTAPWKDWIIEVRSQMDEALSDRNPLSRAMKLGCQKLAVVKAGRVALEDATVPPGDKLAKGNARQTNDRDKMRTEPLQADVSDALFERLLELLRSR